ncbi:LysM peptidoglycan-binding domain-containing protein [Prochlorococcus sp. MIT 1307]|uniref:LysM peptidoglycan-binding domain-containing protein n=1 Tax=Prochlorococcus sp. MIT 1307 TaxID=3096219 RepID=UPI002A764592|nr:LysM peptidoglycan-binding domain-containing protein [Prochlorococcus sp. MIT 1307]
MIRAIFAAITLISLTSFSSAAREVTVMPGETLSEIAERYKISTKSLKLLNGINNPTKLQAGTKLKLPDNSYFQVNTQKKIHKVQSGETLSTIANKYGLTQDDLTTLNNIRSPDHLYVDQNIQIPSPQSWKEEKLKTVHKVVAGDTLNTIAAQYNKNQEELKSINGLTDANYLYVGQNIKLYQTRAKGSGQKRLSNNQLFKANQYHIVKQGESLALIAKKYNISLDNLANFNNIKNPNELQLGTRLLLKINSGQLQKLASNTYKEEIVGESQWRKYGPLQIDWSNWKVMDGSHVAPTLHQSGQALYLAVNCSFRKLNATGIDGAWNHWISPQENFERNLINDLCLTREG